MAVRTFLAGLTGTAQDQRLCQRCKGMVRARPLLKMLCPAVCVSVCLLSHPALHATAYRSMHCILQHDIRTTQCFVCFLMSFKPCVMLLMH